jgi:hypothetical protein
LSQRDISNFTLLLGVFQDRKCSKPLFADEKEIDDFDPMEISLINQSWNESMELFTENNIRELSAMNFFLNSFSYSKDSIHTFLSKPLIDLTTYQVLLFSMGQRNLSIISQAQGSPPDLIGDTKPSDVITWYDQQYSVILGKRNSSK